ncbi:MAG: phenylalanine--tRNA ligase subunit alpha, partial [Chloroflexota bacterium]
MIEQLEELRTGALEELARIEDLARLEEWRVSFLGKRSKLNQILRGMGTLAPDDRRAVGQIANDVKSVLEGESAARRAQIQTMRREAEISRERLDVTLPARPTQLGQWHPQTMVTREIVAAFRTLGYDVVEGPEVEWEKYNFELLNIPAEHPARDVWDTFYVRTSD